MKRKNKKNYYFTKEHEDAIVRYVATDDITERTYLYKEFIEPVFNEMVDKIVYTYKFTFLPNVDVLKEDCKVYLVTILDKYNPEKNSKAFSYFSVICKNWFIHRTKKNMKKAKKYVEYSEVSYADELEFFSEENEYGKLRSDKEFLSFLFNEIDDWESENIKENDKKLLEAIRILFNNIDDIQIFNKKAIYMYIRELTNLNTKQVVSSLFKFRKKYKRFKKEWDNGDI